MAFCAAVVTLIVTIAGVYFKGKSTGANEVKVDAANDLLDDIELKNEIAEDVKEDIANSDRQSRIDSL